MSTLRQPYRELSAEVNKQMVAALMALEKGPLDGRLIELVFLRVSQINGCAYCLEMHSNALRKRGEDQARLDALAGWRVSQRFSEKEQAALAWAEAVTHIAESGAGDEVYHPLEQHFSPQEISDLTHAIALMNAFNRLAVGMRM
ncbi:carboxymuconolactone decarboxylase family protein [Enterobacteriaceae bacterium BIT-l23]|uniref:Carboxymuconolactone decarboxylase family protein n=1 Tax=Jejubacter calystegiae TaxID=2579935 RepID=A0A4P8YNS0_9ENTR|nr:carboxymuconolactone decarboxylase family protein [Jejubacter calystegiae]NUU67066.1 carboxymuconolactone decarboxylase family protein [Enterobacteriaceae bacterium BIT-l23]QCT22519.1 carboxymuconolactone decarboxylase family protein [Jejubacter calystegiae]